MARKPKLTPSNDGYSSLHAVRLPLWPYLVTPICVVVALPATALIHHLYGRGPGAVWLAVALTLAAVALIVFVGWAARPRGQVMQVMAVANTILAFAWIIPAVLAGPTSKAMLGVWALGGLLMSVTVAVYRIMRQARGDAQPSVLAGGEFAELGEAVKQLKDVRFTRPRISGAKVTTDVAVPHGRTFDEVAAVKKELASLLDLPASAVRTPADPGSVRRGELVVVPVDQLQHVPWQGASRPGASIAEPIDLGVREDGERCELHLVGDPSVQRNAVGVMGVVGMSGSGKTELLLNVGAEILTRPDAELHIADARKGGQLPEFLRTNAASTTIGRDPTEDLLEGLPALVEKRSKQLGAAGFKQWLPGAPIPFQVYVIFEAAAVVAGNSDVTDLAESVRSVGICLILELQRATYDRLPTSARANVTTWAVLGVQREDDAEAALSEQTVAAGAAPWIWKNTKPGYFYLEAPGVDRDRWSEPCRSATATDEQRQAAVDAARGAVRGQVVAAPAAADQHDAVAAGGPDGDEDPAEREERLRENRAYRDDDPPDDVDASQPLVVPPGMPRIPFDAGAPRMTPSDARAALVEHLRARAAVGQDVVRPQDLGDVLEATGMSGTWLYRTLRSLTEGDEPVLRHSDRGWYRVLTNEPA